MLDQMNATLTPHKQMPPWNKGKLTGKATATTQTRLVNPDEAPD